MSRLIFLGVWQIYFKRWESIESYFLRTKGKEVAKPITPPSQSVSEEDSEPTQAQRDKDIQKIIALIAKYFIKIYKPNNNNLKTSSNSRNKNADFTLRTRNNRQTGQFRNQRTVTVVKAKETIGNQETKAGKRLFLPQRKDDVVQAGRERPTYDTYVIETVDSNVIPDHSYMCNNEFENDQNADDHDEDERVELANLIANLKLDIDENKKIQKQLRKANATLTHDLKEKNDLTESNDIVDRCRSTLHQNEVELEKLSYLNFDTIIMLSKNDIVNGLPKLKFVKDQLCSSCEV
nr:ribonuclease H-like domain-containing protein [Tanacetum cinerariifolium]